MKKPLKYAVLALGVAAALVLATAIIAAAAFPPVFKPGLAALVEAQTRRTLVLQGDIRFHFFPRLGIELGRAALSERGSSAEFASIDGARLDLAWLPLLRGALVAGPIRVDGLRARLVRHRDGSTNFDDLLRPGKSRFEIAPLRVTGALVFRDEATGRQLVVADLKLETGPLGNGLPGDASARFNLRSDAPRLDIRVDASTRLTLDNRAGRLALQGLSVAMKGEAAGWSDLVLTAKANDVESVAGRWQMQGARIALSGRRDDVGFDLAAELPGSRLERGELDAGRMTLTGGLRQPGRSFGAVLRIPRLTGRGEPFYAGVLEAELEGRQGESLIVAKLSGPLEIGPKTGQVGLPQLAASADFRPSGQPQTGGSAQLSGTASLDLAGRHARLDLAGRLDEGMVKSGFAASYSAVPPYTFNLDIERLDLDRYLPRPISAQGRRRPDFSWLKRLDARGRVHIGELKIAGATSRNVTFEVAPLLAKGAGRR